ncbi:putative DNA processing protein DprA [Pilimelia terevasa]|uniref:Putative DNA processing protein DprA n=1 Tax=Pilimelia terevasa TaxID=53372 RepID=A0A8J3BKP5_9ACTN|nr:DNA-processing protein DprA [Pilimelia terevasa]GGK28015.1 putative DNA processing protein DprA [Pilimelia terevasa]
MASGTQPAGRPAPAAGGDPAADLRARIVLSWLVEPGHRIIHSLVERYSATAVLDFARAGDLPEPRLRESVAARLRAADPDRVADAALAGAARLGADVLTPGDDAWPAALDDLRHLESTARDGNTRPPLLLWVRGEAPRTLLGGAGVAVVGARACSPYGSHVATDLGYGLAERGWTVVSGGAFGIDAAAHRGALTAGGATVAVLACGVDRPYPSGNASLFERILATGLLVSEWPPGAAPHRHRFLVRNRVIAALAAGTVVVEASPRSGALATLRRAAALGRVAMAVPGPVTAATSTGCHLALREEPGARLVARAADVIEEVGRWGADLAPLPRGRETVLDRLPPDAAAVLEVVPPSRPAAADAVSGAAGLPVRTVLRVLPLLVDLDLVRAVDGGYVLGPRRP